jgi:hypothetical protein
MAAQFKQGIITRRGGLVVALADDRIVFDPVLVGRTQFHSTEASFSYRDRQGKHRQIPLSPGTLAFLVGRVPVVAHSAGPPFIAVVREDGSIQSHDGLALDRETSAEVLGRGDRIRRLDVYLGLPR